MLDTSLPRLRSVTGDGATTRIRITLWSPAQNTMGFLGIAAGPFPPLNTLCLLTPAYINPVLDP